MAFRPGFGWPETPILDRLIVGRPNCAVLQVSHTPIAVNQNQYHVGMGHDTQPRLHDRAFDESQVEPPQHGRAGAAPPLAGVLD
jgi:hypothetical protein